ncbi:XdhC/CoxI family protein [Petroclostridium sp. X23]|uniref:XdhC/CoxI family protein n=1 Tax=Petroclostridium sp. X23 TaxID=3045146 RepID=UPI0024AD5F27|nr:XdhC/CoxI family protein [Petroclostridium sp. X23]WHH60489.1 XdhC family protein [Petroclostridium sp. X23]
MSENVYGRLVDVLNEGKRAVMLTDIDASNSIDAGSNNKILFAEDNLQQCASKYCVDGSILESIRNALVSGCLQYVPGIGQKKYLIEPYLPQPKLIVFGGGHISKPLVEFGAAVGFSITLVDDRISFANTKRFPKAEKVICESFEKSFPLLTLNKASFVVIVTRGHRYDSYCLSKVLEHDVAYIGMIGSKRKVRSAMAQLLEEGFSKEKLDSVNAPIGIDIGAVTPEEIAVAIIAQVINFRRQKGFENTPNAGLKTNWVEYDRDVLEVLSKENVEPKAIVTVIATKGSVPRKAGAKMLVWQDGRTVGSIGGGCSEGEVITAAMNVIRDRSVELKHIDMTGYVAEEEGMVCGGIMDVIIEPW